MITAFGDLKQTIPQLNEQMERDYGFSNHRLKDKLWTALVKGSIQIHKVGDDLVLIQTVFLPNSDQPVVAAVIKPPGVDVRDILYVEAERRGIDKIAIHEPTDTGYSVIIEDIN